MAFGGKTRTSTRPISYRNGTDKHSQQPGQHSHLAGRDVTKSNGLSLNLFEFADIRGTANVSAKLTANFSEKGGEQRTIPRNLLPRQGLSKLAISSGRKEQRITANKQ